MKQQQFSFVAFAVPLTVAILGGLLTVQADAGTAASAADTRYAAERATCMNGKSNQDRTTCLKEAGAARDEARRNQLSDGSPDYKANALARCERVAEADRKDCRAMINGAGTTSGTAASGGVMRELVTQSVASPASAASAP